jgi:hypothetical protein
VAAEPDALAELSEVRALAGRPLSDWSDDEWPTARFPRLAALLA